MYERLITAPNFSPEEKLLFKKKLAKLQEKIAYAPFSQALKQRHYGEALRLAIKRPTVMLMFLQRLPNSVKYRLTAWRKGVKIK